MRLNLLAVLDDIMSRGNSVTFAPASTRGMFEITVRAETGERRGSVTVASDMVKYAETELVDAAVSSMLANCG